MESVEIQHNRRGYYTLYKDGIFEGNYDTFSEAVKALEEIEDTKD
jgi:hypothetical protein